MNATGVASVDFDATRDSLLKCSDAFAASSSVVTVWHRRMELQSCCSKGTGLRWPVTEHPTPGQQLGYLRAYPVEHAGSYQT